MLGMEIPNIVCFIIKLSDDDYDPFNMDGMLIRRSCDAPCWKIFLKGGVLPSLCTAFVRTPLFSL